MHELLTQLDFERRNTMHELLTQLLTYARGMWRYRWYALVVAWAVCLAGWAFVYTLPEEYESGARIQINTRSLLDPLLRGLAVRPDIQTQLQMMTETLLSRANIQKVVAKLDPNRAPSASNISIQSSRARGRARGGSQIYNISYRDKNPEMAHRVVQALLTVLVEETLDESRADTDTAQQFLGGEIKEYEARLAEAEQRLAEFKKSG
jgi:polysaccharide chain length determinant protein (PEP-CTERM system associated)